MGDHQTPGSKTAMRLASRGDLDLQRKEVTDGGEVFTGALAKRALRAMGARAMTLDETIIVDDTFDASNPEDQALYAHERFHQMESGGSGAEGARDAEEVAARAIERMVLHRSKAGEGFGEIMRDVNSGAVMRDEAAGGSPAGGEGGAASGGDGDEATAAYQAMLSSGKSHEEIVEELSRFVVEQIQQSGEAAQTRRAPSRTF